MTARNLRWVIAAMLLMATMLNYVDRSMLALVLPDMRKEFALSESDYAHVVSLFLFAYAVMYAGAGYLIDALGTRRGFAVFLFGWSLAQLLHTFVRGIGSLAACRFLLGITEPGNFPAAVKAVNEWFPPSDRAVGIGLFNSGASLGTAIAVPLGAFLTLKYGWRSAFLMTGGIGFAGLAAWLVLYQPPWRNRWLREEERQSYAERTTVESRTVQNGFRWYTLLFRRECWVLILARFLTDPVVYFIIFWLPEYLRKERGFSLAMVGKYGWVPFVFADAGYLAGGWFSSKLIKRGRSLLYSRKWAMAGAAGLLPSAILAPQVPSGALAIAITCIVLFGHAAWIANLMTLPTDLFPSHQVGAVSGLSGTGGALGGAVATLATGWVLTKFSFVSLFAVAGLLHPLAALLLFRLLPERRLTLGV